MENKIYDSNLNNELFGLNYLSDYSKEEQENALIWLRRQSKNMGKNKFFNPGSRT